MLKSHFFDVNFKLMSVHYIWRKLLLSFSICFSKSPSLFLLVGVSAIILDWLKKLLRQWKFEILNWLEFNCCIFPLFFLNKRPSTISMCRLRACIRKHKEVSWHLWKLLKLTLKHDLQRHQDISGVIGIK